MTTSEKLKDLGFCRTTAIIIESHLKTYSTNRELRVVEIGSVIKLSYTSAFKCKNDHSITTPEGVVVFIGGDAGAEGAIIFFNVSAMKAEAKFEEEGAAQHPKQAKAAPSEEDNGLVRAIGKGILYTVGAGAAVAAGVWAWKKWGSNTSV